MSTRKFNPRTRALRPTAEGLEIRQLLSATVSGTDIDGDQWTLRLIGPGALSVTKQNGADGNPSPLASATEINTITVAGTNPLTSKLIGTVTKGANGDGQVFFQTLTELPNRGLHNSLGDGLLAIDMPNFWLGNTTPTSASSTTTPTTPSITIPDGVDTLDFGGVDTTHDQPATPSSTATSDQYAVTLGLPVYGGTRVIINKSVSSTQVVPANATTTTATTIQHAVTFDVSGRLDLFQANEVDGDAANPPGQFSNSVSGATGFGGTWIVSGTSGTAPFLVNGTLQGGLNGSIGDIRIGGNATNLSALVFDSTGSDEAKISNFSVGGETNNVLVVAPNGSRNLYFGLGMDNVQVYSHVINSLQANRGAIDSTVVSDRTISRAQFGGPVDGTNILSGYQQDFATIINDVTGEVAVNTFESTLVPTPPPTSLDAQIGGGMQVLVAGSVTDSIFAASVEPDTSSGSPVFGSPIDLNLPGGKISGKVEGTIDNSNATPGQPTKAFYAQTVVRKNGPVIPPSVPQEPYGGPSQPVSVPGISHAGLVAAARTTARHGAKTPKGPAKT